MLVIQNIQKTFDNKVVLQDISLCIEQGEIVVLLGPSGCGKTTLLRIIAGLEQADNGRIRLHDQDLTHIPVHQRGFGFVFQEYALFPHKNVFQNVAFGLRMAGWTQDRIAQRVLEILQLVGLTNFGERPIHELSGGEQQRVALARSLAPQPRLLLLDEPLGALDRALRERLMLELRIILKQAGETEGITAVYVTHDQAEAFAIADQVVVMNNGHVEQQDTPANLYHTPTTPFVARFLGMENLLEGEVISINPLIARTALGDLYVANNQGSKRVNENPLSTIHQSSIINHQSIVLLIRPEAGRLGLDGVNVIAARLQNVSFRGRYQLATITVLPSLMTLKLEFDTAVPLPPPGATLTLSLDPIAILPLEGR